MILYDGCLDNSLFAPWKKLSTSFLAIRTRTYDTVICARSETPLSLMITLFTVSADLAKQVYSINLEDYKLNKLNRNKWNIGLWWEGKTRLPGGNFFGTKQKPACMALRLESNPGQIAERRVVLSFKSTHRPLTVTAIFLLLVVYIIRCTNHAWSASEKRNGEWRTRRTKEQDQHYIYIDFKCLHLLCLQGNQTRKNLKRVILKMNNQQLWVRQTVGHWFCSYRRKKME